MVYQHLCRQCYRTDYTFDVIVDDQMSLNKWMIFCKEFSFIEKFTLKDMIDIFRVCTSFASVMTLEQFLHAVALIEEKYRQKYHPLDDVNFLEAVMELGS